MFSINASATSPAPEYTWSAPACFSVAASRRQAACASTRNLRVELAGDPDDVLALRHACRGEDEAAGAGHRRRFERPWRAGRVGLRMVPPR
jgi:hypothetical protein